MITLGPRKITPQTLPVTCRGAGMWIWVQLLGAGAPTILEGKNVHNSARFRTASKFDRKYFQNRDKSIDKLKTALSTTISPTFKEKMGELRSTSHRVYAANVFPLRINSARDFGQLYTSIANISGTDQAIDKRKTASSTTIPTTFDKKPMNAGPLTKKFTRLMFTHPKWALYECCVACCVV